MNSMLSKVKAKFSHGKSMRNIAISIVILIEILAITTVAVLAWVETVSSIKIKGDGVIDTYVFTDAEIGSGKGTIDMGAYFKESGDMHFAPASSANGTTMFFPQVASTTAYRKGNSSDKNTSYLSTTFRVKTATNADFFFTKAPSFSALGSDIRVSITTQSEGSNEAPVTQIYALTKGSSQVVNSTTGGTATATVEAFADHIKGKSSTARIFSVGADETKVVTVNVWLQKKSTDMNSVMAQDIKISDLGIVSSLTPRRVTLVPGSEWNKDNPTYYAWCWNTDTDGKFFKLTDNGDGSYSFDYDGIYKNISFVRAMNDLTTDSPNWDSQVWNQTENLTIPASPVDPTFFITSITGGAGNKSKGIWEEPAIVKLDYVNDSEGLGKLSATWSSYTASGNGQPTQILCRGGSSVTISATANGGYQFTGWYTDAAGTQKATPTAASALITSPAKGTEITYYAKFEEVITVTLVKVVDNASYSSVAAGTMSIGATGTTTTSGSGYSITKTVSKGATVTLSATNNSGYTLKGIFTSATGTTTAPTSFTANSSVTYYVQYTINTYNVTAHSRYSTNGTSFSTSDSTTGGTVRLSTSTSGSSFATAYDVKYGSNVTFIASPSNGYTFVGWYNSSGSQLSTSANYTYTLNTAGDVDIYARFSLSTTNYYLSGWINGAEVTWSNSTYKFSQGSSSNLYTLTYTFTGHEGGYQYVTINDGSKVYHPSSTNAGSGSTAPTTTDSNPNGNNKWRVAAPRGTKVTFTWNSSTRALSWTIDSRELYLKPNSNWASYGARFAVYAFNSSGNTWINMTSAGNGYYKATVPGTYTTVIFGRMDPNTSTNNFNNPPMWNRSNIDLPIPADKNCFEVPSNDWSTDSTTWTLY